MENIPVLGVMKFTIFVDASFIITSVWSTDPCPGIEDIFKEKMRFLYNTLMTTPLLKNPCPWVIKFTIFVDHSLVIHSRQLGALGNIR